MIDLLETALREAEKDLKGSMICILGLSFIENSDDLRNAPTLSLLRELEKKGAVYRVHDPYIREGEEYKIEQDLDTALKGCDAVVLMTKHDEYRLINSNMLKDLLKSKVIVDGRNMFDYKEFIADGFIFKGVGKGNVNKQRAES